MNDRLTIAMYGLRGFGQTSGGVEKAVEELSTRLAGRGHEVTVFCRDRYNPDHLRFYNGVRLVTLPAIYTKHLEAISHSVLASLCSMTHYDIVHIHAIGPSLTAFLPRLGLRHVVSTVHALDWKREKWENLAKFALKAGLWTASRVTHRTIAVSRQIELYLRHKFHTTPLYIPNGVSPVPRHPPSLIRKFGVSGGDYFLFLGRLVPEKGAHFLIDAFRKANIQSKLLIVGGGTHTEDYVEKLKQRSADLSNVQFTGPLFGEIKEEILSNALCMVLPSTVEGMPIVLLEAMSCGCPVLCSDIPENLAVMLPEKSAEELNAVQSPESKYGFTFRSESVDSLSNGMRFMLANQEIVKAKADAAMKYTLETYNWDRVVEQTEQVYFEIRNLRPETGNRTQAP